MQEREREANGYVTRLMRRVELRKTLTLGLECRARNAFCFVVKLSIEARISFQPSSGKEWGTFCLGKELALSLGKPLGSSSCRLGKG